MEEDYYLDEDEKVDSKVRIYLGNKIKNILQNAKKSVKGYNQAKLNELYKGKPLTLNLRVNINKPKTNIFDFLTKDRSHLPSIIYLSNDQMMKFFLF